MQNLKQKKKNVSYAVHGRRLKNGNWKTQLGYYLMFIVPAVSERVMYDEYCVFW